MKIQLPLLFLLAITISSPVADAHEMRPGYLEIHESGADVFEVLWKVPARGLNERLGLYLRFAADVQSLSEPVSGFVGGAHIQRMRISRVGGLTGSSITIAGLDGTYTDVLFRLERLDGTGFTHRLTPSSPSIVIEAGPNNLQVATTYTLLGIEHILLGFDHLLFVACLIFVSGIGRSLLITITGFTLAHSVTLALSALGWVQLPIPPVEAVIALSIVFLAIEIARGKHDSLTFRYPIAVSASFGLLHGFGFASVLREIGLPKSDISIALLCFNLGVELGQIAFVVALAMLIYMFGRSSSPIANRPIHEWPSSLRLPLTYMIGSVASFLLITRIGAFLH